MTGLVVTTLLAIRRDEIDRLRAILHNCILLGPDSQNRAGHKVFRAQIEGAVAWVKHVQPTRGARLEEQLHRVAWRVTPE